MILLVTDYSLNDPYVGQLKIVLHSLAPGVPVVDLLHGVADFNAHAGAHLLDALKKQAPLGSVLLCVVDPGVGSDREALVVVADGRYYVGPDNGLLSVVAGRVDAKSIKRIAWRPEHLSASFHGRDLFAPVAARIARGDNVADWLEDTDMHVCFDTADLPRILYIDHYGNAWTGLRGDQVNEDMLVNAHGHALAYRPTFSAAQKGETFWYVNSVGLVEIAANRADAAAVLGLSVGDPVTLSGSPGSHLH
jgi:S-adenosylmethionine hydrolase